MKNINFTHPYPSKTTQRSPAIASDDNTIQLAILSSALSTALLITTLLLLAIGLLCWRWGIRHRMEKPPTSEAVNAHDQLIYTLPHNFSGTVTVEQKDRRRGSFEEHIYEPVSA